MSKPWLLLLSAALLAPACTEDPDLGENANEISAPESFALLAFLNGAGATFTVLDRDVGLDRRAAQNIVDHVRTDKLDTYAELDAIAYVATSALDKLLAYVHGHGLVPDYLTEGVPFSGVEADAVLAVANGATRTELDTGARLDARAAANIVAARPIADLDHLAAVSYVGAVALTKLKTFAPGWHGGTTCTFALGYRAIPDAQAWSSLLEEATWGDFGPSGSVYGLQATCADTTSVAGKAALATAIAAQLRGSWGTGAETPVHSSSLVPGGAAFANLYDWTLDAVQSKIDGGAWNADDPTWVRRDAIRAALVGPSLAAPASFLEMTLVTDAEECSEHAAVLVDTRDGGITVVYIAPRC